jgi:hypothetical protein
MGPTREVISGGLVAGWCQPGPDGSWTVEKHAVLDFCWAGPTDRPLVLEFDGAAFRDQPFTLSCNGVRLQEVREFCSEEEPPRPTLPASLARSHNRIEFDLPNAHSPRSTGKGKDDRRLRVSLKSMRASCLSR